MQALGLASIYRDKESETGKWLQHVFGLSLLSPEEVTECFMYEFMENMPEDDKVTAFVDYMWDNYVGDSARFPPSLWASMSVELRTTTACEAFHSKLNTYFHHPHPDIAVFVIAVKELQKHSQICQNSAATHPTLDKRIQRRRDYLNTLMMEYTLGRIPRFDYVKKASYNYIQNKKK